MCVPLYLIFPLLERYIHSLDAVDWADNARDILNFLLYFLPAQSLPATAPLPECLDRVSDDNVKRRISQGFSNRTVIGMGHSIGGCSVWVVRPSSESFRIL